MNAGPTIRTEIKICGLTRLQDAQLAVDLGAWALGFIFFSKSPRVVSATQVKNILSSLTLKNSSLRTVGVFVNPTLEELKAAVLESGINTIQLHGNESVEFCQSVRTAFPGIKITKAFRIEDISGENAFEQVIDNQLIDSATQDAWGGTGITVDWQKAAKLGGKPVILAGGLTPENVARAVETVKPFAVDVSSGVESAPGIKSEYKLKEFFSAATGTKK